MGRCRTNHHLPARPGRWRPLATGMSDRNDEEGSATTGGGLDRQRAKAGFDDVFRMQLWWDHLPSPPEVLNRGGSNPSLANHCPYYCSEGVRGSTWHLLAE